MKLKSFRPSQNWELRNRWQHGGGSGLLAAMRQTVMNFVSVAIDEARDCAVWSNRPPGPNVQESHGIEIQRIRALPVGAEITADVFAVWSDGHPPSIIIHVG